MIRALAALALIAAATPAMADCEDLTHKGTSFTVCEVTSDEDLRLWHSDADGQLYGSFAAVDAALGDDETIGFAMNAGMYHQDRRPVGLHIEEYREFAPLVDGGGYGNFGLVPNGVFCATNDSFAVIETNAFRADAPDCRFATQSGPMLVVDGELHPKFIPDSDSRNIRNGVGVSRDGSSAIFAISNRAVNFHDFATLFRDRFGYPNALYFDGKVSRLFVPELDRSDSGFPLGPIIGTVVPR